MKAFIYSFVPGLIILGALSVIYVLIRAVRLSREGRRNPLTRQLLRSPGETLRTQIEDFGLDILYYFMMLMFFPLLMYSVYLSQELSGEKVNPLFHVVAILVVMAVFIFKLWKRLKHRNDLRLGLDCEMAVGQELNQLMLDGYRVYHDFPAEGFNIDHVVVGLKGVFAVETKGRSKSDKKLGFTGATVVYDGQSLIFPGGTEQEPIAQAKRQATWLSKWLSSAVGDPVSVQPVLALPGWYVDRRRPADFLIFNGTGPDLLLKWGNDQSLSDSMIKRIAHQLDQRCRDVEPVAYPKQKK